MGAIATDGCLHGAEGRSDRLSIVVQQKDLVWLKRLKFILGANNLIRIRHIKNKDHKYIDLTISQGGLLTAFSKWKITPKKSHSIKFPCNMPDKLKRHFIRGCLDGDGTVCFRRRKGGQCWNQKVALVSGSLGFLKSTKHHLIRNNILSRISTEKRGGNRKPLHCLLISTKSFESFFKFLYKDSSICLTRKKVKYKKLLKHRSKYVNGKHLMGGKFKRTRDKLTYKFLYKEFVKLKKSPISIGRETKINKSTVYNYLKNYKLR